MFKQNKHIYFITMLLALLSSGCLKDDTELPEQDETDYYQVYMPTAVQSPKEITLRFNEEEQTITYGANYGGRNYPDKDIAVDFAVTPAMVDSFNQRNGTEYEILPASAYSLSENSAIIPAGALATMPLDVKVVPEGNMALFKPYLLPISISLKGTDFKLNETLKTAYYLVTASLSFSDFEDYNRDNWEVTEVSSEEPAEGADNGGLGIHTIDGKNSSFWHTAWANSSPGPPHHLVVDMGETKTLHGFSFIGRQSGNAGKPQSVTIELSTNGTDWETAETFTLQNTNNQQKFFLRSGFKDARYFKIVVTAMFGGANYTHLAELGAF